MENLRRAVGEMRSKPRSTSSPTKSTADADSVLADGSSPAAALTAYSSLNARLKSQVEQLKKRDGELEAKYRRVIALCTNVPEESVDGVLGQLVMAVESEGVGERGEGDVGRVREFLRRVEMVI